LIDQLGISRITATKYLNELTDQGFVSKHKLGGLIIILMNRWWCW